ncbi:MAG: type II toxin-antitoxin system HicA family toxin [Acidobacteria bacterium]|jgi:mRNA interferase HicA|nr:type II toxin-antitoxin system HicA family toxin [Acidobacteriota bacterium]
MWLLLSGEASELKRWLRKRGCTFVEESRHTRIVLGSKVSRMPRHPSKDIKTGTLRSILGDLDLKM